MSDKIFKQYVYDELPSMARSARSKKLSILAIICFRYLICNYLDGSVPNGSSNNMYQTSESESSETSPLCSEKLIQEYTQYLESHRQAMALSSDKEKKLIEFVDKIRKKCMEEQECNRNHTKSAFDWVTSFFIHCKSFETDLIDITLVIFTYKFMWVCYVIHFLCDCWNDFIGDLEKYFKTPMPSRTSIK